MTAPRPLPGPREENPATVRPRPSASARSGGLSARLGQWRPATLASRGAQVRRERDGGAGRSRLEPPIDPTSWTGALILICVFGAVVWIVQLVNAADDYHLDRFGLQPRTVAGLWGILTQPFLHSDYHHVLSNTLPLLAIGWIVMLSGLRVWAIVTVAVVVFGGALTWLVGPSHGVIVGASGMIFGWLGYLLARAYFSRSIKWIFAAVVVLTFFGTLLGGVLPTVHSDVSWQSHACGFVAGIGIAALLHPRGGQLRRFRRSAVS